MYNIWYLVLAGVITGSDSFLDSLYAQLDVSCTRPEQFACRNSKCVNKTLRCDGKNDCADNSDEEECDVYHCQAPNYFKCKNSHCVFSSFVCDDENDCGDYSDEESCDTFKAELLHPSNCSKDEWKCLDRLCIPKDWVCNGDKDCLDGSDETLGCTQDIVCDGFRCKNGHCIPSEWSCDGTADCQDNSDEEHCESHVQPKDCILDDQLFLCANKQTCIKLAQACDNVTHCPDKSDEGDLCMSPSNTCTTHKCSHDCVMLSTGPKCLCPKGYRTIDDKTCQDIDECQTYGICDQKCSNTPGSYECYCDYRYILQEDKRTCKVVGGEAMMIFSSKTEIRGYFLQSEYYFPIAKQLKQVVGVSFDGHHVYWTDIFSENESIVKSLEDGSDRELIVTSGLGAPEDLAVDWITGNIYFTDSEMQHIGVCTNDGLHCAVLVNEDVDKPRGIVLHPVQGMMYWSDWGKKPEIARSKMDGTEDLSFVANNIHWPNGLSIDYPNERLYWADAKLMTLESIKLDGTDRRVVLSDIVKHPYAIAVFENRLFWSDWASHSIQSCDKFTGKNHHTLVKEKREFVYGIHIYHSALKSRAGTNACALAFCSDLCLLSGETGYTCACPQDKVLSPDKHTCKHVEKKQVLVIAAKDMLVRLEHQLLGKHDITALPSIAKNIGALVYDSLNNTIYMSDTISQSIIAMNLNTGRAYELIRENIGEISSIAFDYLGNNIYWCDATRQTIEIYSVATRTRTVLLHDMGGETPISIVVVPEEGVMFVAFQKSTENGYHIDRLRMDGTGRSHVIEQGLMGPITLTYDQTLHRIFWADSGSGLIESTSVDGDDRHGFRSLHTSPVSLATLNKDMFWTNENSRRVYWALKDNSGNALNKKITIDVPEDTTKMLLLSVTPKRIPAHPCRINNNNCSHICLLADKTAVCHCPLGMNLLADNQTCHKPNTCASNEFHCLLSDTCIPYTMRCNHHSDCLMGDDEADCDFSSVTSCAHSGDFKCRTSGECISSELVCDLHYDCADKSDESDCADKAHLSGCPKSSQYQCGGEGGECIEGRFVCDGFKDCLNGEDERECGGKTCTSKQFRCLSGSCIPGSWECDREYDCPDMSDEHMNCVPPPCTSSQFTCAASKICIAATLRCDRVDDCGDNSDEDNCAPVTSANLACSVDEYQCLSGAKQCLPGGARCNGTSECDHHEDESGCSECHVQEFNCANGKCIPAEWLCDRTDDCGDGSDEVDELCKSGGDGVKGESGVSVLGGLQVPCEHGFRCKNGNCIDYSLVCDGVENCYDGSDENGACANSCERNTNPCGHVCHKTPSGPVCDCHEGYQLAGDAKTCTDIAECSRMPPVCSQMCVESPGSFSCRCHDGFVLRSDRRSCKSIGDPMDLYFTADNEIRKLLQTENALNVLYAEDTPRISGLDINTRTDHVYFTIEDTETMHRIHVSGNATKEYITQVGKAGKIAVDWITENVYYIDSASSSKSIKVCNFGDQRCAYVLGIDTHSTVSALAVDPVNGYLFYAVTSWWVFNSPHSVIYKANLDGTKMQEVVKSSGGYVTGLTFDRYKKQLYYSDQHLGTVATVNYDGTNRINLFANLSRPTGLNIFEDHLYYLTSSGGSLSGGYMGRCALYGDRACDSFRVGATSSSGALFVIGQASRQQYDGENVCKGHQCSHVCVGSEVGARCLCEGGQVVGMGVVCDTRERGSSEGADRRPQFKVHSLNSNEKTSGSSIAAFILIPILVLLTALTVYYFLKKRSTGNFNVSMRFYNPGFGIVNDGNVAQPPEPKPRILQPGLHEYNNPIDMNEKDMQAATEAILQKVNPLVQVD